MICLGFNSKLEIGKIYTKDIVTSKNGGFQGFITFSVIKEATYQEWEDEHPELTEAGKSHAREKLRNGGYIYWIMVD